MAMGTYQDSKLISSNKTTYLIIYSTLNFKPYLLIWLRGLDSNQRPSGYEPDELPDCSTPRQCSYFSDKCIAFNHVYTAFKLHSLGLKLICPTKHVKYYNFLTIEKT